MTGAGGSSLDSVLETSWEALAYERWVQSQATDSEDYLFASARARFEAADEDVLVAPPDLAIESRKNETELSSKALGGGVKIPGASSKGLERLLRSIDGQRRVAELRAASGRERPLFERVLERALGLVLFVPEAISRLETALPGTEAVRFPGAPYEIVRSYWTNMASVRREAQASLQLFREAPLNWLRRLHVTLLMGDDLATFYRPASRITQSGVRPGSLYETPSRQLQSGSAHLLLSGPRVGVGFIGGERYHRALASAVGDLESLSRERQLADADGLSWGGVLFGRSIDDEHDAAWFCPPRPLTEAHFDRLFAAYAAALQTAGTRARPIEASSQRERVALGELARFHYRFVRLHPFRCANQSLAMNLVNLVLTQLCGAGMPHLLLDQLALRLTESAYVRVFELAVERYAVPGEPIERWRVQREKKSRAYALIERLKQSTSDEAALALVRAEPLAAGDALIVEPLG